MTLAIHVLAVVGALEVAAAVLRIVLALCIRRSRRKVARRAAMGRHPAGQARKPDGTPWKAHLFCCDSSVYGDTLDEVYDNFHFHRSQCPNSQRRNAA